MAKRSLLSGVRDNLASQPVTAPTAAPEIQTVSPTATTQSRRPSRDAKLHVGGYFDPGDPVVTAFQKLKVDLRRSQQDMLLEALQDFVAKHRADSAFRGS